MSKPDLFIVPASEAAWSQYAQLCFEQYNVFPFRTEKTVLIEGTDQDDNGVYQLVVAGCVLIDTDGPYLFANNIVINQRIDRIEQYNAAVFLQDELRRLAASLNKTVMMLTNHAGLIKILSRHGFTNHTAQLWFYSPSNTYIHPVYETAVVAGSTLEEEIEETVADDAVVKNMLDDELEKPPIRRRGRPKGSKNKKKNNG